VWPLLERAVNRVTEHRYTSDQLLTMCERTEAQLWIIWDFEAQEYAAAAITMLTVEEEQTILEIELLGGRDFKEWIIPLWTLLRVWGVAHGAHLAVIPGRKAWERVLGFDYLKTDNGVRIMSRPITLEH
jgi:hypothetical protein